MTKMFWFCSGAVLLGLAATPALGQHVTVPDCAKIRDATLPGLKSLLDGALACSAEPRPYERYVKGSCSTVASPKECVAAWDAYECAREAYDTKIMACYEASSVAYACNRVVDPKFDVNRMATSALNSSIRFLEEGKSDLQRLRRDLEDELDTTIGISPDSWRQTLSEVSAATKIASDLVVGIAGFSSVTKKASKAADWMAAIEDGESIYSLIETDAEHLLIDTVLGLGSDLSPSARALGVAKTFFDNLETAATLRSGSDEARSEVRRQLEIIDGQIASIDRKIREKWNASLASGPLLEHMSKLKADCSRLP